MKIKIFLLIFLLISQVSFAEKTFFYRTYDKKTRQTLNCFNMKIEDIIRGKRKVFWEKREGAFLEHEEYILDHQYATKSWTVQSSDNINYQGKRIKNILMLKGLFKGRTIEKKINIDERPFYYNPKLGLMHFVFSKEKKSTFWAIRHDDLSVYLMEARNKGDDIVIINGKKIKAIKVIWTLPDFRSTFFKRTYWFRKSDGYYLKQTAGKGKIREMIAQ